MLDPDERVVDPDGQERLRHIPDDESDNDDPSDAEHKVVQEDSVYRDIRARIHALISAPPA